MVVVIDHAPSSPTVPLSQASLPSSGVSTPTSLQTTAILEVESMPVITVSSSHAEQAVDRSGGVRRSLDSGLDVGNSAEDLHTLQVSAVRAEWPEQRTSVGHTFSLSPSPLLSRLVMG